jgi:hypothetical protein
MIAIGLEMKGIKYIPKVSVAISNFLLLISALLLFLGRTEVLLRANYLANLFSGFYQHVSNFCISYMIFSSVGFMWLLLGVDFIYITGLGVAILLGNFIYELWISVLNTPDIIDAYYGFFGTITAFLFLSITKKYGLKVNSITDNRAS